MSNDPTYDQPSTIAYPAYLIAGGLQLVTRKHYPIGPQGTLDTGGTIIDDFSLDITATVSDAAGDSKRFDLTVSEGDVVEVYRSLLPYDFSIHDLIRNTTLIAWASWNNGARPLNGVYDFHFEPYGSNRPWGPRGKPGPWG